MLLIVIRILIYSKFGFHLGLMIIRNKFMDIDVHHIWLKVQFLNRMQSSLILITFLWKTLIFLTFKIIMD